ncbi:unnamed protein product [Scytosiphon promiscuus]
MCGSATRTVAALWTRSIDIDQGDAKGHTPLMIAALNGCPGVVRILLNRGADVSVKSDDGFTALHVSARKGNPVVTDMLVRGGSDVEAKTPKGFTPLHDAAGRGHLEAMRVLVGAGANPDSEAVGGQTPLYNAAWSGHVDTVKELLRASADPLPLTKRRRMAGRWCTPLDVAAGRGHSDVVREMLRQVGVANCDREEALRAAAKMQHLNVMAVLMNAGVGLGASAALMDAIDGGAEASVKFILRKKGEESGGGGGGGRADRACSYVNTVRDGLGRTPLLRSVTFCRKSSARMVRLLVDAGADTTSAIRPAKSRGGAVYFNETPLSLAMRYRGEKKVAGGKDATEDQLQTLESIYRLLSRVDTIRAASWLWPRGISPTGRAEHPRRETNAAPARKKLARLHATKRETGWRGAVLASMLGFSTKV